MKEDLTFGNGILVGIAIASVLWVTALLAMVLGNTKFCPECGKRYYSNISYCKYDGAELKDSRIS